MILVTATGATPTIKLVCLSSTLIHTRPNVLTSSVNCRVRLNKFSKSTTIISLVASSTVSSIVQEVPSPKILIISHLLTYTERGYMANTVVVLQLKLLPLSFINNTSTEVQYLPTTFLL